jgi:hypothetical protein
MAEGLGLIISFLRNMTAYRIIKIQYIKGKPDEIKVDIWIFYQVFFPIWRNEEGGCKTRDQVSQVTAEARLAREQSEKDATRYEV